MKQIIFLIFSICIYKPLFCQLEIDLSNELNVTLTIDLKEKAIRIINILPGKRDQYSVVINKAQEFIPPFENLKANGAACDPSMKEINGLIVSVQNSQTEKDLKYNLDKLIKAKQKLPNSAQSCIDQCDELIQKTIFTQSLYFSLENNQTITVTVKRITKAVDGKDSTITWTKVFKTPEKSPWLIHYGLTYTPALISKTDNYYSFADTSVANRFTIKKENNNGPKPWDNISATINFTYPFHTDNRSIDAGFTAGFGLNPDFLLSGHTGLSLIIGENVILGTGIAFMQKYKLKGEYVENQIVKTNLDFDALHHKVWLPEIYFTIGFRFSQNPFAKKASDDTAKPASAPKKEE